MLVFLTAMVAVAGELKWTAEPLPDYDQLFQRTNGWIGADGDFTVALPDGSTLWLFSDTFIGEIRDGQRHPQKMINNSAARQTGNNSAHAGVEFFYRQSSDGRPASLLTPADGKGWFWIFDGTMAGGKLFLFLPQIEKVPGNDGAFGFRQTGLSLGEISNPLAPPPQWNITQTKVPFVEYGAKGSRSFGSAVLATNGFIYIYGTHEVPGHDRKMILARAPENSLGDFSTWRFRTPTGWSTNVLESADLCGRMASEYSVSWLPALQQYALICTEDGLSSKIILHLSPEPWGPWDGGRVVFKCQEMGWDKSIICYAGKAHPMLAQSPDEMILTYAANSVELSKLMSDTRLYWPRFVRLKFQ